MSNTSKPTKSEIAQGYKYTLWILFERLNRVEKSIALKTLPKLLGVSERTLYNWLYIRKDEHKTVPADTLYKLSTYFGCAFTDMWTDKPESLHIEYMKMKNMAVREFNSFTV